MNQGMVICYPLICIIPTLYRSYSPECQAKTLPLHIVIDMNMGIDNLNIVEVLIAEKESGVQGNHRSVGAWHGNALRLSERRRRNGIVRRE
jgi:hypothetical protein